MDEEGYYEKSWSLQRLTYVGKDYVSLIFAEQLDFTNAPHPMQQNSHISTGEIVKLESILGYSLQELLQKNPITMYYEKSNAAAYWSNERSQYYKGLSFRKM